MRKLGFLNTPYFELFAIPMGAFADKDFPVPHYPVWEWRKHRWVTIHGVDGDHND